MLIFTHTFPFLTPVVLPQVTFYVIFYLKVDLLFCKGGVLILDNKTAIAVQIAAAAASNAMPALRLAVSKALEGELSREEIEAVLDIAQEIQIQPSQHTQNLAHQLLREPIAKKPVVHEANCSCGCHDHHK